MRLSSLTFRVLVATVAAVALAGCLDINNMNDLKEAVGANDVPLPPAELEAPLVKLVASHTTLKVKEPLQLSAEGTLDPQGQPLSYVWNLGDGTIGRGPRVSHPYATPGNYLITLTVTNGGGLSANATHVVTVTSTNLPPVASFDLTNLQGTTVTTVDVDSVVKLTAAPSRDPEGGALRYHWDLGDGRTSTAPDIERAYTTPGRYTIILTVTDDLEQTARVSRDLAVNQNVTRAGSVGQAAPYWEGPFFTNLPAAMEITLSYQAKTGTEVLSLTLKDGASRTVANASAASTLGNTGLVTKTITLPRDVIFQHGRGDWSAVVSFDRGVSLDVPFNLQIVQRY
ncbi:MAG TPA: PKD domain-containing protein [Candidatus Thermoplasmatota archaeon]|nr:PKD domain-containing protein [Candidatus Thermoplasmatota archaeon]